MLPLLDVSMVVNIHAGGSYLRRTMRSLEASAAKAAAAGLKIELLVMLDRSPPQTQAWVDAYRSDVFSRMRVIRLDNGSLGLSRQEGIDQARAQYIQLCDEDDLVSTNTTLESYRTARCCSPETIVVPEYLFGFGALKLLAIYSDSSRIPPIAFFSQHPYISRIFVHREISRLNRFIDVRLGPGYAYEDWHFNATAIAKGAEFAIAPGVILFYRHRANSLSADMNSQSARLIPPTPLLEPQRYLALARPGARRFLAHGQDVVDCEAERSRFLVSPENCEEVGFANEIDPAISLEQMHDCIVVPTQNGDFAAGAGYFEACRRVGGIRFTDVGIVSSPATASGEAVFAAVRALAETDSATRTLILVDDDKFDEATPGTALRSATIVNVGRLVVGLSVEQRRLIAYRLIEMAANGARLHFAADEMSAGLLGRYVRLLSNRTKFFYKSDDRPTIVRGVAMSAPGPFDFLSEFLDEATFVIHSSAIEQRLDRGRLDRRPDIWRLVYLPVETEVADAQRRPLSRAILTIGLSATETSRLQQRCEAAGLDIRLVSARSTPDRDQLPIVDLALIMAVEEASYRDLVALLQAGLPIIAPCRGCFAEILERGDPCLRLTSEQAGIDEAGDCIAAFYSDAALRERLANEVRRFLETYHSPAGHRSAIARLIMNTSAGRNGDR